MSEILAVDSVGAVYVVGMCDPCASWGIVCDGCNVCPTTGDPVTMPLGTVTVVEWGTLPRRVCVSCQNDPYPVEFDRLWYAGPFVSPARLGDTGIGGCVVCGCQSWHGREYEWAGVA